MSCLGERSWRVPGFLREASSGYYTNFSYFLSKTLFEFPATGNVEEHIGTQLMINVTALKCGVPEGAGRDADDEPFRWISWFRGGHLKFDKI